MFKQNNRWMTFFDFVMAGSGFFSWIREVARTHDPLSPHAIVYLSCAAALVFLGLTRLGKIKGIDPEEDNEF